MARLRKTIVLVLLIAAWGCSMKREVTLSVRNDSELALEARARVLKGELVSQSIELGRLDPDNDRVESLTVEPGESVEVLGVLPEDRTTVHNERRSVPGGTNEPFEMSVDLQISAQRPLEPEDLIESVSRSLLQPNARYDFPSLDVKNAVKTRFGSIAVVTPPTAEHKGIVHTYIPASGFMGAMSYDDLEFSDSVWKDEHVVTGSTVNTVRARIPFLSFLLGEVEGNWESSRVYRVEWDVRGVGPIERHDGEVSHAEMFEQMSDANRKTLLLAMSRYPGAMLLYVNQMYALEHAELMVFEGKKVGGETIAGNTDFLSGNSVWRVANRASRNIEIDDIALTFDGILFEVEQIEGGRKDVPPPGPDTLAEWLPMDLDASSRSGIVRIRRHANE